MTTDQPPQKSPEELQRQLQQEAMTLLVKNKGSLFSGIVGIKLFGLVFMTGFIALGTFIFGYKQHSFFQTALRAEGTVISRETTSYIDDTTDNHGNKQRTTRYRRFLNITFQTENGQKIVGKVEEQEFSPYNEGEKIDIAYDPESPKDVRKFSDRKTVDILFLISKISFAACVFFFLCILFFVKNVSSEKSELR